MPKDDVIIIGDKVGAKIFLGDDRKPLKIEFYVNKEKIDELKEYYKNASQFASTF